MSFRDKKVERLGSGKSHFSSLDFPPPPSKINNNKRVSPNYVGFLNVRYLCDFLCIMWCIKLYVHFTRFRTLQFLSVSSPGATTTSINSNSSSQEGLLEPPADSRGGFRFDSTCDDVKRWRFGVARFTAGDENGRRFKNEGGWDWWEPCDQYCFFVGGCGW